MSIETLRKKFKRENGDSEVISVLFIIPLVIFLLFAFIDISMYFQSRSTVQSMTRDAARSVAIYGGNDSRLNPNSKSIATTLKDQLYKNGECTVSDCAKPPQVKCSPTTTKKAGQITTCSVRYTYKSLNPLNPISAPITNKTYIVTATSRAETGF